MLFLLALSDDTGFFRVDALRCFRLLFSTSPVSPSTVRAEEVQVARSVLPFGRMVALSRPSGRLPRLSVDRSYASDETWLTRWCAATRLRQRVLRSSTSEPRSGSTLAGRRT
ncbi:hypothetical protein ADK86_07685 [Streptomyces sp. NRRL F-5755]|nr:hypothetical protein ADK86_07685 [Streptomyces sp. NRRL F-5755]